MINTQQRYQLPFLSVVYYLCNPLMTVKLLLSQKLMKTQSRISPIISVRDKQTQRQLDSINKIEKLVFQQTEHIDSYERHDIEISEGEVSTSYFIPSRTHPEVTYYLGHGFGGSSLMFFPAFNDFLEKGNVVTWEVRGMGISVKGKYPKIDSLKINDFYVEGLRKILNHYNHGRIILVSHSLSAYISLRYLQEYPQDKRIEKLILLSPVGITSKIKDYRNKINSLSMLGYAIVNSFGWTFKLTFKSPMRTILKCLKKQILKKSFSQFQLAPDELDAMVELFLTLIDLPDRSENIFFKYFLPRVLPRQGQSIEQISQRTGLNIQKPMSIYFGGDQDWTDKDGAERLTQKHDNIKVHRLRESGHMICLCSKLMEYIIEQETA